MRERERERERDVRILEGAAALVVKTADLQTLGGKKVKTHTSSRMLEILKEPPLLMDRRSSHSLQRLRCQYLYFFTSKQVLLYE